MAADAGPARAAVWIGGSVQGVGMRWWVSREADRLGLVGSVENLWDGRVLVDAQGRAEYVVAEDRHLQLLREVSLDAPPVRARRPASPRPPLRMPPASPTRLPR